MSQDATFSGGYCHCCVRWQWLRSTTPPHTASIHSTLIKAQIWEEGEDCLDGRIFVVATSTTEECSELGCWKYLSLPKGEVLPNRDGKNVSKVKPPQARLHCEYRPQPEMEYSVWACYGGGSEETNVVEVRGFRVRDIVCLLRDATTNTTKRSTVGEELEATRRRTDRVNEWTRYEINWHAENNQPKRSFRLEPDGTRISVHLGI